VVGISFIMTDVLAILQPCLLASVLTGSDDHCSQFNHTLSSSL